MSRLEIVLRFTPSHEQLFSKQCPIELRVKIEESTFQMFQSQNNSKLPEWSNYFEWLGVMLSERVKRNQVFPIFKAHILILPETSGSRATGCGVPSLLNKFILTEMFVRTLVFYVVDIILALSGCFFRLYRVLPKLLAMNSVRNTWTGSLTMKDDARRHTTCLPYTLKE